MNVHMMTEPGSGFLVTGCDDVEKAKTAVLETHREELADMVSELVRDEDGEYRFIEHDPEGWFESHPGKVEVGRVVPANTLDREFEGIAWWWRTGYELGKRGVTTAVIFQ